MRGGQKLAGLLVFINDINALGLETAQGMLLTTAFYWDRNEETRAWAKRFMERNKGVVPTYIQAGAYSATLHYLKAVAAAGTDRGDAVAAKMKQTPINDFSMKNVKIREDGQAMRPTYIVQVKGPGESRAKGDYYKVLGEIPAEQAFRPLNEGGCDFIASAKQ